MRLLPRFELSATQLIATALAAITATVAASYLGVAGTVIGAAIASVVSAVGNAVYTHSLRRTHERVREAVPVRRRERPNPSASATSPLSSSLRTPESDDERGKVGRTSGRWHGLAIASLAVFVAVLAVVTGTELVTGRPLSDLVRGSSGSGTTLFGGRNAAAAAEVPAPVPTVTRTVVSTLVITTPTVTQTAPAVTQTATPTVTTTPTATPTATQTQTAVPTTPGPSAQPSG